jgi:hypothetical protein
VKRGRRQTPLSSQVPKERNRIAHLRVRRTVALDEMTSVSPSRATSPITQAVLTAVVDSVRL